jgi:hypothetical protein
MRKSNWTPSIVPVENDRTIYLVADDLGKPGRTWREIDYEATNLETVIQDLLTGQYSSQSASSLSIPPNAGLKTYPSTSPTNFGGAASCKCAISPSIFKISRTVMRAATTTFNFRCPCAWCDR